MSFARGRGNAAASPHHQAWVWAIVVARLTDHRAQCSSHILVTALNHSERRIDENHRAILLDDAVARSYQPTAPAAPAQARFDDFNLDMDRVARHNRTFDIQLHMEKRKACMLHCGLREQALAEAIGQWCRDRPSLDIGLVPQEFNVREQDLGIAGAVAEIDNIDFGNGSADRLKLFANRKILEK
jgi:hypothetical protein